MSTPNKSDSKLPADGPDFTPAHNVITAETLQKGEYSEAYYAQRWYKRPIAQIILVSFVCFMCPGMFNALNGLGGGGKQDATTADNGNVALYSTFSVFAFFGGTVANKIGLKPTLIIGASGYSLYIGALYSTVIAQTQSRENFVIAAGAILGVCAGLLWTAQGAIMLAYATERTKGRYVALFWSIFNFGAVIGAIIPMATNWNRPEAAAASGTTYIVFLVLTLVGLGISVFLAQPKNVILPNGRPVEVARQPTWVSEFKGLLFALKSDRMVILLFPFFLSSNWFYAYQFNAINGSGYFGIRGRSLNNFLYWTSQIVGSIATGFFLDWKIGRRLRAWAGLVWLTILVFAVFGGNYAFQRTYTRETVADPNFESLNINTSKYAGLAFLYVFNGILDAAWQTYAYWLMGAMSNEPRRLAYLTGFYKGLQSAGSAITFRIDALKTPFMTELASTWGLLAGSLLIMVPVLLFRIHEHTVEEGED
ncbi:MFS general substrate transporter [Cystobasidium minutum MCA 4210]|uniref:MFS general substrate transporter n=1 Tax=Cystobasidium minutum MCA 4210 TaxID=1397322 RepID=UPI0034CDBDFD|eukprot:jgi/Rhomi1/141241/e_gw1.2.1503.1